MDTFLCESRRSKKNVSRWQVFRLCRRMGLLSRQYLDGVKKSL